jgi:CHAD domain-containing protein
VAYRFEPDENVHEAFARCAREQLDDAVRELSEEIETNPVKAVHSARKALKKERALLRMARAAIPAPQRQRELTALRAARGVSEARESEVVIQTLDQLAERFSGQLPASTFAAVRERLELGRASARVRLVTATRNAKAVQDLGAARLRIGDLTLTEGGWRALEPGVLRTYGRGRKAFRRARRAPSPDALHAWRKRVKDLSYQLRLLAPACGPAVRGQAKEAGRLAELLGDDHDLAELRRALAGGVSDVPVDPEPLLRLIDHRRAQLEAEAIHVGERLYAEKPGAFMRRLRQSWYAGRSLARAARHDRPAELAEIARAASAA